MEAQLATGLQEIVVEVNQEETQESQQQLECIEISSENMNEVVGGLTAPFLANVTLDDFKDGWQASFQKLVSSDNIAGFNLKIVGQKPDLKELLNILEEDSKLKLCDAHLVGTRLEKVDDFISFGKIAFLARRNFIAEECIA